MVNLNIGEDKNGKRLYMEGRVAWGAVVSENSSGGGKDKVDGFCMGSVDPIADTMAMAATSKQFLNSVAKESGIPEELLKALFLKFFMQG